MNKDEKYQVYAGYIIRDIPTEIVEHLVNLFMVEASINMGNDFTDETLERVIYHIQKDFSFIPASYVASAFIRGSLGHYGAGRLVPRTVHGWLNEASLEYNRIMAKERQRELSAIPDPVFDLHKYPLGKAIAKKIEWYNAGLLNDENWDRVQLKELAEVIGRGVYVTFEKFYK